MTVTFQGIRGKATGCGSCGRRRVSHGLVTTKEFHLPSGSSMTFIMGRAVEVSDQDGSFLLDLTDDMGNKVFK